jgi:hypothetical protein
MGIIDSSSQDPKRYGLRIYTLIKNGPLEKSGASELTDFIIPPEEVVTNQISFNEWVYNHSNQEIVLSLYSLLTKKFRDIKLKTNPIGSKEGIIGASVQKENWTLANKKVLHIISVKENSFSEKKLGLIPGDDYIVGVKCKDSQIIPLNNDEFSPLEILGEIIRKKKGKSLKFYIYNVKKGARDVTVNIDDDYYFTLGLEGAFGALHMFPSFDMKKDNENEVHNDNNNNISDVKENAIINEKNDSDNKENKKEQSDNPNNTTKVENKIIEKNDNNSNNIKIEEENSVNKDFKEKTEQNQNNNIAIDSNDINIKSDENEKKSNKNTNDNIDINEAKPSDNNINKIVEEISSEKILENHVSKEEENNNLNNIENKESININNNKEKEKEINVEKKEEIIEEIKKENLLENIIKNKE